MTKPCRIPLLSVYFPALDWYINLPKTRNLSVMKWLNKSDKDYKKNRFLSMINNFDRRSDIFMATKGKEFVNTCDIFNEDKEKKQELIDFLDGIIIDANSHVYFTTFAEMFRQSISYRIKFYDESDIFEK
jgi:hypothetical protein